MQTTASSALLIEESDDNTNDCNTSTHGASSSNLCEESEHSGSDSSSSNGLGRQETRAVNRSKLLVYLILFISAVAVGTATYIFVSKGEEQDFEVDVRITTV